MKKIKKYIYPFVFSAVFLILYIVFVFFIIGKVISFPYGSYAPAALAALFAIVWVIFVLPIYFIRYSKVIVDEKIKFLFAVYNGAVVVITHILPFGFLRGEEKILIAFSVWVALWCVLPPILRLASREMEENVTTEDATTEETL